MVLGECMGGTRVKMTWVPPSNGNLNPTCFRGGKFQTLLAHAWQPMLSCFETHMTFTTYHSNNIIGFTLETKFLCVVGLHLVFRAYIYFNLCKVPYINASWPWHLKGPCWILGTTFHPLIIRCWIEQGGWSKFSQLKKIVETLTFLKKNEMINVPRIMKDPFDPSYIHRSQYPNVYSFRCTKGQWMTSASLKVSIVMTS